MFVPVKNVFDTWVESEFELVSIMVFAESRLLVDNRLDALLSAETESEIGVSRFLVFSCASFSLTLNEPSFSS